MKRYRLLVDWGVVNRLRELPMRARRVIHAAFSKLGEAPDLVGEFHVIDENGRRLEVFIVEQFAFYYWIDFADRHVKVLAIEPADRRMR